MKYEITEEYIDDIHWNSGFWESTIKYEDGEERRILRKKSELNLTKIKKIHKNLKFQKFWEDNKEKYKEIAKKDFSQKYKF